MKRIKFREDGQKIRHACEKRKVRKKNYSNEVEKKYHVKDVGDDIKTCLEKRRVLNPLKNFKPPYRKDLF
jgi:hypothetical protein